MYGSKEMSKEAVQKSVEWKVSRTGFCCKNRSFQADSVVPYGASEMTRVWLERGLVDCAVIVCEGAGTVITSNGRLVQSIGARLTGIIKTSPISETIAHIVKQGGTVLDGSTARIDQVKGVEQALAQGFKRVAVSVAGFQSKAISEIREFEKRQKADILIFSVCNTRVDASDVKHIAQADVVCASASRILRTRIGPKALLQLGVTIPVYALTGKGKKLILAYLAGFKDGLVVFRSAKLPYEPFQRGPKLRT
jgi:putative methanogenesis marker protein 8